MNNIFQLDSSGKSWLEKEGRKATADDERKRAFLSYLDPAGLLVLNSRVTLQDKHDEYGLSSVVPVSAASEFVLLPEKIREIDLSAGLHWRLTNGKFSGLELHASLVAGKIAMQINAANKRQYESLSKKLPQLSSLLSEILEVPMDLKLRNETADNE